MKELSIEEKAKAYDKALVIARSRYSIETEESVRICLELMFSELAESEDEKIRKAIIHYIEQKQFGSEVYLEDDEMVQKYISWLEKQGEQKETPCDKCKKAQPSHSCQDITALGRCYLEHEQKPADKVEPKFKKGDWIVYQNEVCQIKHREEGYNLLTNSFGINKEPINERLLSTAHLWTIEDAKDGDVLSNGKMIVIFKNFEKASYRHHVVAYIGLDINGNIQITDDTWILGINKTQPATKEQRDLLFQKMKEAGYEWDAVKKELKKIEQKSVEMIQWKGDNLKEVIGFTGKSDRFDEWFKTWGEYEKYVHEHNNIVKLFNKDGSHYEVSVGAWIVKTPDGHNVPTIFTFKQKSLEWTEEDDCNSAFIVELLLGEDSFDKEYISQCKKAAMWLKSLKNKVQPQPKQEWSEENEKIIDEAVEYIKKYAEEVVQGGNSKLYVYGVAERLESLSPVNHWKPSEEQMETLGKYVRCTVKDDHEHLEAIYNHLKKLM